MTLKEAHEIQRKELIALRRENTRLKEGTYTDAEKLEHEKIIRHLRFENQTLAKDKERYHHLWRDALTRPDHQIEDLIKIDDLEKEICALKHANEQLSDQLQEAQDVIAKLKAQMNRDHENSSLPSSVKPFHKKIKNSRIATGRKLHAILKNGKVEICGINQGKWIRIEGTVKEDLRREARVAMMEENIAALSSMYSVDDNLMTVLYFENGTTTIYSFTEEPKVTTL